MPSLSLGKAPTDVPKGADGEEDVGTASMRGRWVVVGWPRLRPPPRVLLTRATGVGQNVLACCPLRGEEDSVRVGFAPGFKSCARRCLSPPLASLLCGCWEVYERQDATVGNTSSSISHVLADASR